MSNPIGWGTIALEILYYVSVAVVGYNAITGYAETEQLIAQQNYPHEKRILQMQSTWGKTTDNGLPYTFKGPEKCGRFCKIVAGAFTALVACVSIFDEKCKDAVTPHDINLNSQPSPCGDEEGPCYINKNPDPICGTAEACYVNKSPNALNPLPPIDFSNPSLTIIDPKPNLSPSPNLSPLSTFERRLLNKGLLE